MVVVLLVFRWSLIEKESKFVDFFEACHDTFKFTFVSFVQFVMRWRWSTSHRSISNATIITIG